MKIEEKIKVVKRLLEEKNIDQMEFLVWLSEGINPMKDWDEYSVDELIKINIEYDEEESEREYTTEEQIIEVMNMWIGEVEGDGFLGDGTL
jgi:hypothetical protein